jgi:hypothetical protein
MKAANVSAPMPGSLEWLRCTFDDVRRYTLVEAALLVDLDIVIGRHDYSTRPNHLTSRFATDLDHVFLGDFETVLAFPATHHRADTDDTFLAKGLGVTLFPRSGHGDRAPPLEDHRVLFNSQFVHVSILPQLGSA